MNYPTDRYPDLRDGKPDPELEHLVAQLDLLGRQFISVRAPDVQRQQTASLLHERALAHRRAPIRTRLSYTWGSSIWPTRRAGLVGVAALMVILVLTGATLAVGGSAIFPWNYGFLQRAGQFPQSQEISIARSACGYTLRLQSVYADANVFIMGYSVTKPDGRTIEAALQAPKVTDSKGNSLPESDYAGASNVGGARQYQSFDTESVSGQPNVIKLHLDIPGITIPANIAVPSACAGESNVTVQSSRPSPTAVDSQREPSGGADVVRGPFIFDLTAPYHSGREAQLRLTATEHGRTLTLERAVSTPLETRLYVSGSAMNAYPTITANGRTLDDGTWAPDIIDSNVIVYSFPGSLYSEHGSWLLSIHSNSSIQPLPGEQPLPTGVWNFTFVLP